MADPNASPHERDVVVANVLIRGFTGGKLSSPGPADELS
jgi:hypothetical protein